MRRTEFQEAAIFLIEGQQANAGERTAPWMVGEQLKDICRAEPRSAELLAQDLTRKGMSIVDAEKRIKAFADGHKVERFACVPPQEAKRILREFYGLPDGVGHGGAVPEEVVPEMSSPYKPIRMDDLF